MIDFVYSAGFIKSARKLPLKLQDKLADLLPILQENPFDNFLHTKKLSGRLTGLFSFRITRDWRVFFRFLEPALLQLIIVKNRKDIYRN